MSDDHGLTLGIEEEFFVVDPVTRAVVTDARPVLDRLDEQGLVGSKDSYDQELLLSVVESRTAVCQDLSQVRAELRRLRACLIDAAATTGHSIVAAGTLPTADWHTQRITPNPRYQQMAELYQQLARRQVICGCHVHIGMGDQETAVQVLNRVARWLPVLLALSASSPFWMGQDTGYASYRAILWASWPTAGPPGRYRSVAEYRTVTQSLIDAGTIIDAGQIYRDVRLGTKHDTLEFRIADACTTIDETVLQAGLCRALVQTCLAEVASSQPLVDVHPELLRSARWRASRSGLEGNLVDVLTTRAVPTTVLLDQFLTYLRPALEDSGDWDEITALVQQTKGGGTSARRQRHALARAQRLEDVVDLLTAETAFS
jgi:carboxylate-amine ligase